MACWFQAGWEKSAVFELALSDWTELGMSRFSAARGLAKLEGADLISVDRRSGLPPLVTLRDPSDQSSGEDAEMSGKMGWKQIGNHLYYYRSRLEGSRVVSEYVGTGESAWLSAKFLELTRPL
jgi:hypothetical protein